MVCHFAIGRLVTMRKGAGAAKKAAIVVTDQGTQTVVLAHPSCYEGCQ